MIKKEDKIIESSVLFYETEDGRINVDVILKDETIWLSQKSMAELFGTSTDNIGLHLKNIYREEELDKNLTTEKISVVQKEGSRNVSRSIEYYNLDAIIAVGYRVSSRKATKFRIWATKVLKEYLIKGFVLNDERLKENGNSVYFQELIERIRDIRSSEKVFWRKVLDIYATSIDYDSKEEATKEFFKVIQNKMHWAITKMTAAEIINERADSSKLFMGLTNFKGVSPNKKEIIIAKNYLTEDEITELNLLVSAYLDLAEIQARSNKTMTMKDWLDKLDGFLKLSEKDILQGTGKITSEIAKQKAYIEYEKYRNKDNNNLSRAEKDFVELLNEIKEVNDTKSES